MSHTLQSLIAAKKKDKQIQIIAAIVSIVFAPFTFLFSLFLLGLTHAISTIYWIAYPPYTGKLRARKIIERLNIFVVIAFVISTAIGSLTDINDYFLGIAMCLLYVGAALGTAYFAITLKEIRFYKSQIVIRA